MKAFEAQIQAVSTCFLHFLRFRLSDFFFKLGSFLVLAGAALTGYGCSCPCSGAAFRPCAAPADVPGQACYAKVAYVPMACCFATLGPSISKNII